MLIGDLFILAIVVGILYYGLVSADKEGEN